MKLKVKLFRNTVFLLATVFGVFSLAAQEGCDDQPSTSLWCGGDAQLILKNVTISPAAPTNAPYDSIVCVGDSISAHLPWSTLPSTNVTQTCHTCNGDTPTNWCENPVTTTGASPYNITNEFWNEWYNNDNDWWGDWTNGIGDNTSFSFTNATVGWVGFDNISAMMTTNAPGCGVDVNWAANANSYHSYAFVAVDSISPDSDDWVTNVPCDTYLIAYCPGSFVTVTAYSDPGMDDKFLPAGWSMTGGSATTNADGSASRTKRLVDRGTVGSVTVTATSGCSSKSVKIIIYQAKIELDAQKGSHLAHLFDFGHSWWNLTIQPSDVYLFLPKFTDPDTGLSVDLGTIQPYQGMGGFYDDTNLIGPGRVIFANPQPDQSTTNGTHTATGSYWWCVSFNNYVNSLMYVYNLATYPPEYRFASINCTTEAEAVGTAAGVQNVPPTIYPGILSKWLNGNAVVFTGSSTTYQLPEPPTCSCSQ